MVGTIHRAKLNGLRKLATVIALLLPADTVLLSRQLGLPKPQANARRSRISPFVATAPDRDRSHYRGHRHRRADPSDKQQRMVWPCFRDEALPSEFRFLLPFV